MKIAFHPRSLTGTLNEIRIKHPTFGGSSDKLPESLVEQVRKLLLSTPHDNIQSLARELTPQQVKACLFLLDDEKVGEKALKVLLQRARRDVYIQAWRILVRTYPASESLQQLVDSMSDSIGTDTLVNAGVAPPYVADWLKEKSLATGVFVHYHRSGNNHNFDEYLFASGLHEADGLFSKAWYQLLTVGTSGDLTAQGGNRILMEFEKPSTGGEAKTAYGRHYLNTLQSVDKWHEPILHYIFKRYGLPSSRQGPEDPFWKKVNDDVKSEYLKWYITKEILDFFEGERADFWRDFVNARHVIGVQSTLAGRGFMIDFGNFGVIEFKDIGNAAYIYPKEVLNKYWANTKRYTQPADLKDRSKTIHSIGSEGRIIHNPPGAWQQKAKTEIQTLLRRR